MKLQLLIEISLINIVIIDLKNIREVLIREKVADASKKYNKQFACKGGEKG